MEQSYVLMTDSDSDLHYSIADERNIPVVRMPYTLDGEACLDDNGRAGVERRFFRRMREGATPATSPLPVEAYIEYFEPVLRAKDLLFIAFSSRMSRTLENAREARRRLLEKYPGRRLEIVDTLSISGPMALLVLGAHDLYAQGKTMDEVAAWVVANRMRAQAWMTVDDLKYLARGGRISPSTFVFGTMLDLRPIICMGKGGRMDAVERVRGRHHTLKAIVERTAQYIEHPEDQTLLILHGDVPDDATALAGLLRARIPTLRDIRIQIVGPVIGSHCGPGTLASVFMGREREY